MSMLTRCQVDHPCRPTNWRWERSRLLQEHGRATPNRDKDDEWTHKACYLRYYLSKAVSDIDRFRAIQAAGDLGMAYELWDEEIVGPSSAGAAPRVSPAARTVSMMRHELEARILTNTPLEETARRIGVKPGIIEAYEAVYFNVLDKLGASAYIAHQVVGPSLMGGAGGIQGMWKMLGWSTQSQKYLDEVITGCQQLASAAAAANDGFAFAAADAVWLRTMKAMMATRLLPINEKTSGRLLELHARFQEVNNADEKNDTRTAYRENLEAAFGVVRWMVGVKFDFVGKYGEPRAHEMLAAAQGLKIAEIPDTFTWPEPNSNDTDD